VAIDDQVGVYNPIPTEWFFQRQQHNADEQQLLKKNKEKEEEEEEDDDDSDPRRLWNTTSSTVLFGQTIGDRINKDKEMRLIAQRCAEHLSPQDFARAFAVLYNNNRNNNHRHQGGQGANGVDIVSTVLDCYECVLQQRKQESSSTDVVAAATADDDGAKVAPAEIDRPASEGTSVDIKDARRTPLLLYPSTTDLYVVEAIFRPQDAQSSLSLMKNRSGLESALHALASTPVDQAVAWGNTNTQSRDYREALHIAARQGRPVHFVLYNALSDVQDYCNKNKNATTTTTTTTTPSTVSTFGAAVIVPSDLESIGFAGLLRNNLRRYLETGRYIPARAIWLMLERTAGLIESVVAVHNASLNAATSSPSVSSPPPIDAPPSRTASVTMSKLQRDQALARLAGMEMNSDRTVKVEAVSQTATPVLGNLQRQRRGHDDSSRNQNGDRSNNDNNKRHRGMNRHHDHPWNNGGRDRDAYQQQQKQQQQQQEQQRQQPDSSQRQPHRDDTSNNNGDDRSNNKRRRGI
jgi:hypothetical protein